MNNETQQTPVHPMVVLAGCCGVASVGIVALAFCLLHNLSVGGMWAVAAMAAAPSLMGVGIAWFMTQRPSLSS